MEPILAADEIQADIAPGFRVPFQAFVALQADLATAQAIVSLLRPRITRMREAADYHRERIKVAKELRAFGSSSFTLLPGPHLQWVNIALGPRVLEAAGIVAPAGADRSFALGLAARSTTLGDPQDPNNPGHRSRWVVGGPDNTADILLLFGSDDRDTLLELADQTECECLQRGAIVLHRDIGERLPGDKEHFGFRDGVSQPAMRGRLSDAPDDFLIQRKFPPAPEGPGAELAAPGDVLIWPGEFIFGYPRQDSHDFRASLAEGTIDESLRNGSFLVYRRLAQHVEAFRDATAGFLATLQASEAFSGVTQGWVEAQMVGRWPSGAPLVRHPETDPGEPPGSLDRFNHFAFNEATAAVSLPSGEPIDGAPSDREGERCPRFAHIRKVNPRDVGTNQGPASHTQRLRILRRGIPFVATSSNPVERGLIFISFQRSIRNQFELLTRDWMNSTTNPEAPDGHDVLVGQAGAGERSCTFRRSGKEVHVSTRARWIVPTGGGYFFCPSVATLESFAGARRP